MCSGSTGQSVIYLPRSQTRAGEAAEPAAADFRLKRDPFLVFTKEDGLRYHPLIDFAGAQFPEAQSSYKKRDFFGFRNNFNAYFDPGTIPMLS